MDERLLLSLEQLEREHWWFVVRRRLVLEVVGGLVEDAHLRVVEVGCGTGGMLADLRARYPDARVSGIEPSQEAAVVARQSGCEVSSAYLEDLPLDKSSVDLLLALDVLEHCADDVAAAREALRVLGAGGHVVVTVPALPSLWGPHDELNHHHRRYTRDSLSACLGEAGFELTRCTYFNSLMLPAGYLSRIVARATGSAKMTGVELPARPVNALMRGVFGLEIPALRRTDLPLGMSLLAVGRKPAAT